jgi:hypothetical protein
MRNYVISIFFAFTISNVTPSRPIKTHLNGNTNNHSTFHLKGRMIPLKTIDNRSSEETYILVI